MSPVEAEAPIIRTVEPREIAVAFELMRQLRPHLASPADFEAGWRRQAATGYRLAAVWAGAEPRALAGFRVLENYVHGRFLYVDDLVVGESARGQGLGAALLDWLKAEGRALGCDKLVLDTAIANLAAQRFYRREGLRDLAMRFHFALV